MSASPAGLTPGRTPNGDQPLKMRRPKNADPLVRPKKRTQRPPVTNGIADQKPNGSRVPTPGQRQAMPQHSAKPILHPSPPPTGQQNTSENGTGRFSAPSVADYHEYPLVLTKRAIANQYRHHIARFSSKRPVDPRDPNEFVPPVRLQRRDPRNIPEGAGDVKSEDQHMTGVDDMDDKERERQEILKAERDAKREAELAQVAPSASTGAPRKYGKNMKKTEQVYRNDKTDDQKKRSQLRYEEALPWILEGFDSKSVWMGNYEAALSDTYAMMSFGADGVFRIIPLEKWYKFTQKSQFKTLTADEAEVRFNKKVKEPRWFMGSQESKQKRKVEQENKKIMSGLYIGRAENNGGGSGTAAPVTKHEDVEGDDLDFQEDFADDEDNVNLFDEDEETKAAQARIKKDQLQANVFDLKPEQDFEKQEKLEKKEKEMEKLFGKRTKKALMKREKNYIYDSDSTDNPYSSESESEDTAAELAKEEERKKAEEAKSTPEREKPPKTKNSSGASSKGTNTPSHRTSKHGNPSKPSNSSTNLKRAGSPLNSEASGNDSTRKKRKKKHPLTSSSQPQVQSNSTLQPPSRPHSPSLPPPSSAPQPAISRKPSNNTTKRPRGGGSGSDTEGNAASGGEMSEGARKRQKLKLNAPSKNGTPSGSRSGSPDIPNNSTVSAARASGGSRAGSPVTAAPPADTLPFPTVAELRAQVPTSGITTQNLLQRFKGRIMSTERQKAFMDMMMRNTKYNTTTKVLMLKEEK